MKNMVKSNAIIELDKIIKGLKSEILSKEMESGIYYKRQLSKMSEKKNPKLYSITMKMYTLRANRIEFPGSGKDSNNEEEIEKLRKELRHYEQKKAELLDQQNNENLISFGDISFNLHNRTLSIGTFKKERSLQNIDKPIDIPIDSKNTPISIMLLYCIIRDILENDVYLLRNNFNEYSEYKESYTIQTGLKTSGGLSDFGTYVSKLRKILDVTGSKYEITKKHKPFEFKKKIIDGAVDDLNG